MAVVGYFFDRSVMLRKFIPLIFFMIWSVLTTLSAQVRQYQHRSNSLSKQNLISNTPYHWVNGDLFSNPIQQIKASTDTLKVLALLVNPDVGKPHWEDSYFDCWSPRPAE